MSTKPQREPEETPAETQPDVGAYGRVWQRWDPTQGSSQLSLKAMAVLYDAGRPLTPEELVDRLLPQLDTYSRSYLEAWWLRRRDQIRAAIQRKRMILHNGQRRIIRSSKPRVTLTPAVALRAWLMGVFRQRTQKGGQSLTYEKGRFSPGARPPRAQTKDGTLVEFTPEQRQEMVQQEQQDRVTGWQHAMQMEWQRIRPQLESMTDDQSRLLVVAFLARRFSGFTKTGTHHTPLSETTLRGVCHHLLSTENPAVQRAILEQVLKWACESPTDFQR